MTPAPAPKSKPVSRFITTIAAPPEALVVLAGVEDVPVRVPDGLVLDGLYGGEVVVLLGALVLATEPVVLSELVAVTELAPEDAEEAVGEAVGVSEDKILPELHR